MASVDGSGQAPPHDPHAQQHGGQQHPGGPPPQQAPSGQQQGGAPHGQYQQQGYGQHPSGHDPYAAAQQPAMGEPKTNVFAVLALVGGIVGLIGVLPFIGSVLAVVFAMIARKELQEDPTQQGKGFADWGLILGVVGLVFWLLIGFFMVMMAAIFGEFFWWMW